MRLAVSGEIRNRGVIGTGSSMLGELEMVVPPRRQGLDRPCESPRLYYIHLSQQPSNSNVGHAHIIRLRFS
jgi:hypothetical protein